MLTRDDIDHLADLARLAVADEEKDRLATDLGGILAYVSQLEEVTTEASPTPDAGVLRNVMREDGEPTASGTYTEAILANAPETEDGYFKMKAIFRE